MVVYRMGLCVCVFSAHMTRMVRDTHVHTHAPEFKLIFE